MCPPRQVRRPGLARETCRPRSPRRPPDWLFFPARRSTWVEQSPCGCLSGGSGTVGRLASPKSSSLVWSRPVTHRLAGLMSRWTIPLRWAASKAWRSGWPAPAAPPAQRMGFQSDALSDSPLEQLHGQVRPPLMSPMSWSAQMLGMVHGRGRLSLPPEPFQRVDVPGRFPRQELQGHGAGAAWCLPPYRQCPSPRVEFLQDPVFGRNEASLWQVPLLG